MRRILLNAGLSSPRKRRPPKHRVRRQRMPREGMLVRMDGSYHRWLGDDGPQFMLLIAVDDTTGAVAGALFCGQEDARNYFLLMQGPFSAAAHRWPSTLTGTGYSSTRPGRGPPVVQPSSVEPWTNSGSR